MTAKLNRTAYDSRLDYRRIVYNNNFTIAGNGGVATIPVPPGVTGVPHIRIWAELFAGEYSYFFTASAQYAFMLAYENAGLWGYHVDVNNNEVRITNYNTVTRRVYLRIYA